MRCGSIRRRHTSPCCPLSPRPGVVAVRLGRSCLRLKPLPWIYVFVSILSLSPPLPCLSLKTSRGEVYSGLFSVCSWRVWCARQLGQGTEPRLFVSHSVPTDRHCCLPPCPSLSPRMFRPSRGCCSGNGSSSTIQSKTMAYPATSLTAHPGSFWRVKDICSPCPERGSGLRAVCLQWKS